jgi:hypothetical protein
MDMNETELDDLFSDADLGEFGEPADQGEADSPLGTGPGGTVVDYSKLSREEFEAVVAESRAGGSQVGDSAVSQVGGEFISRLAEAAADPSLTPDEIRALAGDEPQPEIVGYVPVEWVRHMNMGDEPIPITKEALTDPRVLEQHAAQVAMVEQLASQREAEYARQAGPAPEDLGEPIDYGLMDTASFERLVAAVRSGGGVDDFPIRYEQPNAAEMNRIARRAFRGGNT